MTKPNWTLIREQLWERSGGRCEASGRALDPETFDAHHRRPKGSGGTSRPDRDDLDNLLALDPEMHNPGPLSVHGRPAWSTARGYLVPKHQDHPGYFPVWQPHNARWINLGKTGDYTATFRPLRVGFTGSRGPVDLVAREWLSMTLTKLQKVGSELLHGSAVGADDCARTIARRVGFVTIAYPSTLRNYLAVGHDDVTRPPRAPLDRNHTIVDLCDVLVAVPDQPEHLRSGTWATVRYARRRGIPIFNWQNSEGGSTDGREPPP